MFCDNSRYTPRGLPGMQQPRLYSSWSTNRSRRIADGVRAQLASMTGFESDGQ